jgi:hypothetical protein
MQRLLLEKRSEATHYSALASFMNFELFPHDARPAMRVRRRSKPQSSYENAWGVVHPGTTAASTHSLT